MLRDWATSHPSTEVVLVNVDLPSLRARKVMPFLAKHGLVVAAVRNLQLDSPDPALALAEAVDGWPDTVPVTLIIDAKGNRSELISVAVSAQELSAAVARATATRP